MKCHCWWRVQRTKGNYGIGSYSKDEWLLIGLNKGSSAELSFSVKRAGTYKAYVYPLRAPDYGRVEISVNGIRSNKTIDGFAELVMPGGQHSLGQFRLNGGSNVLEVKNIGRNTRSKGFLWAIDAIELSQ